MKQIIPEIYIKNCKKAIYFYKDIFGGEIKNLKMSEDMPMFDNVKGKVIHSELHINPRCVLYFLDILEPKRAKTGNITIVMHMDCYEDMVNAYNGLIQEGVVGMKMQKTFLGEYHAIVTDRFGAPWALNFAE